MDLLKEHANISSTSPSNVYPEGRRGAPTRGQQWLEGGLGRGKVGRASALAAQARFLCENAVSGILRIYVKVKWQFLEKAAA